MSRHSGTNSTLLGRVTNTGSMPRVFADSASNFWLSADGPAIGRILPDGKTEPGYVIATNQCHANGRPKPETYSSWNPVCAVEDGRGRVWFWSDALAGAINQATLRGVVIADGGQWEEHPVLEGVPDRPYSVLARKDAARLWLAVEQDALYEVDVATLRATKVTEPEPRAFEFVQKIFAVDADWYVIAGAMWNNGIPSRTGKLWRLRAGTWQKLLDGLDSRTEYREHPRRPWVVAGDSLWLGAFGSGAWCVPLDGRPPVLIDWRRGWPLADTQRLLKLADGRLLGVGFGKASLVVNVADVLAAEQTAPAIRTLTAHRALVQDAQGGLWGSLADSDGALSEWDGQQWQPHPLPAAIKPREMWYLTIDARHRVWWMPDYRGGTTGVFDPARGAWEVFTNYPAALQAQLGQALAPWRGSGERFLIPSFSADGRITFRDSWWKVNYFNGQTWQKWGREEITGDKTFPIDGPPFFDRATNVAVNIAGSTWELTAEKGWHTKSFEAGFGDREFWPPPVVPPHDCPIQKPDSIVRDSQGAYWLTSQNQLFKALLGLCVPQFAKTDRQPFADGRRLTEAQVDRAGNVFLHTDHTDLSGGTDYVILSPRGPVPATHLTVQRESADTFTARYSATATGTVWFVWRLDGDPWSAPRQDSQVKFQWLPAGTHRLEMAVIDDRLQIDPVPATATLEVQIDQVRQLAALIAALGGKELANREAAVLALVRQPARALPALKAARATANDNQRWWIDVAIQQIEEKQRKVTP